MTACVDVSASGKTYTDPARLVALMPHSGQWTVLQGYLMVDARWEPYPYQKYPFPRYQPLQ